MGCVLPLGVENTLLLEDFGDDRDGGVDWVGDDENERLGGGRGDACGQVSDDACVDLQRVKQWLALIIFCGTHLEQVISVIDKQQR